MTQIDPEILVARRAFPETQRLMADATAEQVAVRATVGWYDQDLDVEMPAFAVVRADGEYAELVGEIIKVTVGLKSVFVYVHRSANAGVDLALCRRAFLELAELWAGTVRARVEIL